MECAIAAASLQAGRIRVSPLRMTFPSKPDLFRRDGSVASALAGQMLGFMVTENGLAVGWVRPGWLQRRVWSPWFRVKMCCGVLCESGKRVKMVRAENCPEVIRANRFSSNSGMSFSSSCSSCWRRWPSVRPGRHPAVAARVPGVRQDVEPALDDSRGFAVYGSTRHWFCVAAPRISMRILQRYVLNDLLRVFGLSIFVLTVLLVVMGVAGGSCQTRAGGDADLQITPWIIPSLLPYTIPATLLLTVCIVYGRMAGDTRSGRSRAAGINVFAVLGPSFVMGAVLSLGTFILTDQFIPLGRARIERIVTLAMEDIFLEVLRANNTYNDAAHGISIHVTRVEDRAQSGQPGGAQASTGSRIRPQADRPDLPLPAAERRVRHDHSPGGDGAVRYERAAGTAGSAGWALRTPGGNNFDFDREDQAFPMPAQNDTLKAPRNMTIDSLRRELVGLVRERDEALHRQVIKTVLALSEGNFERFSASEFQQVEFKESLRAERHQKLRTEIHGRVALSCSCFFFVLIGSPIAIIWGKRQFLTNFALCFTPILLGYYPIVLLTMNLCRDGVVEPAWGMWVGNAGLLATAVVVLRRVFRN